MTRSEPAKCDNHHADDLTRLNDTPMQRKLRHIAPIPVGVVFIQRPDMTDDDIRGHFRTMKKLGFTCLKQVCACPGTSKAHLMHVALEEGIIPWWYADGGWEAITDELLRTLGIPLDTPIEELRTNQKLIDYQTRALHERIDREVRQGGGTEGDKEFWRTFAFDPGLAEEQVTGFVAWLEREYSSPAALMRAWNMDQSMIQRPAQPWESWDDVRREVYSLLGIKEYRRRRDIMRFKADLYIDQVRRRMQRSLEREPEAPVRAGGEMGLFLPFASRSTDMEGIAQLMADGGSFYPSIHLAWHFEESDFSVVPEVYMQAAIAADWFKGGWSASWESTGGVQQLSGGKGMIAEARDRVAGFTVDDGVITQLMLSYLAGGFKGFGLWCWNSRAAGWEAGEYALLDRNDQPTPRAVAAGRIGRAAVRLRDELWRARKEPLVGVYTDFDSDAMWAAISLNGRDMYRYFGVRARIGASRALCNANVPWEHVTGRNLRAGLAQRYPVIYLPAIISLSTGLLEILEEYVRTGGRLVMDLPSLWYDQYGRLLDTGKGSLFEKLFGCVFHDSQYSSNVPRSLDGVRLEGFVCDMSATNARVIAAYDNGQPAITHHAHGEGVAVIIGYDASLASFRHPSSGWEERLVSGVLGELTAPYRCEGVLAFRLVAPEADHYFLVNNGPACTASLSTDRTTYHAVEDAVTGEMVDSLERIEVAGHSGRWLRLRT